MIPINTHPTPRQLRLFAALWFPLFGAALGLVLWWRFEATTAAVVIWVATALGALAALSSPAVARGLFVGLSYATYPIGWAISWLALGLLYFVIMTPLAWMLRATGRDPLQRRRPSTPSLWHARPQDHDVERAFRQF